jgi:LTXXQ motif family protein
MRTAGECFSAIPFNQERIMKRSLKITLGLAAVAAGLAATAYAQAPFQGPGYRGGMGQMHGGPMHGGPMFGDPSARADAHLADLKQQLSITAAQESQWQAFANAVKQQAQGMAAMRASMQPAAGTMPERMDQRVGFMKQRVAALETLDGAAKQLYGTLTMEQKAVFDKAGPGAGFGPGRGFGPGNFGPRQG